MKNLIIFLLLICVFSGCLHSQTTSEQPEFQEPSIAHVQEEVEPKDKLRKVLDGKLIVNLGLSKLTLEEGNRLAILIRYWRGRSISKNLETTAVEYMKNEGFKVYVYHGEKTLKLDEYDTYGTVYSILTDKWNSVWACDSILSRRLGFKTKKVWCKDSSYGPTSIITDDGNEKKLYSAEKIQ